MVITEAKLLEASNTVGPHTYIELKTLIEQRNFSLQQVLDGAQQQVDMCGEILRTGESRVVRTEEGTETVNPNNAEAYMTQGYNFITGTVVYAKLEDKQNFLESNELLFRHVTKAVIDNYMLKAELINEEASNTSNTKNKVKVRLRGW